MSPSCRYEQLRQELDQRLSAVRAQIARLYSLGPARADTEMRAARMRLAVAEKSSIEDAVRDGLITMHAAAALLDSIDKSLDDLRGEPSE